MTPPTRQENRAAGQMRNVTTRNPDTAQFHGCSGGVLTPPYKMGIPLKMPGQVICPGVGLEN